MNHHVFSVYDQAAQAYLPPFFLPEVAMAKRIFMQCINSDSHQFAMAPEDYTLFCLGNWSDETSIFTPMPNGPETLGNGVEYVRQDDLTQATEGLTNGKTESTAPPVSDAASIQPSSSSEDSSE